MAGPNRPDDNPKDFSFLHADPATSEDNPLTADSDSFPELPDAPAMLDASAMPGFTDLNFGDVPFSMPPDAAPTFASPFPSGALDIPTPKPAPHVSSTDDESPRPMLAEFDAEMVDAISDDFNADSPATDEDLQADESFRIAAALPSADAGDIARMADADPDVAETIAPVAASLAAAPLAAAAASRLKPQNSARKSDPKAPKSDSARQKTPTSESATADPPRPSQPTERPSRGSGLSPMLLGYAVAITVLLLFCLATGRLSLFGNAALESLPDVRPLAPNEFRKVPDGTPVPDGHVLNLGDSRRFGDVVVTPVRVTREPLKFQGFLTGQPEESLTTTPVLKLWLKFENQSGSYAFPPFDAGLMSHRTPPLSTDDSVIANSFLTVTPAGSEPIRVLNYLQTMDSNFVLIGQESAKVIAPDESLETFIACSDKIDAVTIGDDSGFTWRVQFRKGVSQQSGNGVTTLVDVQFNASDIH